MNGENEILNFFMSPEFTGWLFVIKMVFIGFTLLFLSLILIIFLKSSWFKKRFFWDLSEFLTYRPSGVRRFAKQWVNIKKRLETGSESEYKLAVIEADSILDETLKNMGYAGETLGDRLKSLTPKIVSNLDQVFEARKTRNNIVHDPDYKLDLDQAKKTLEIYEKALIDLHGF